MGTMTVVDLLAAAVAAPRLQLGVVVERAGNYWSLPASKGAAMSEEDPVHRAVREATEAHRRPPPDIVPKAHVERPPLPTGPGVQVMTTEVTPEDYILGVSELAFVTEPVMSADQLMARKRQREERERDQPS